jgi:hypothetical protein
MAKKKSRRHRGPRTVQAPNLAQNQGTHPQQAMPVQAAVTAPPASMVAPKAVMATPGGQPSHNLGLELRTIAVLGGGAIIILALLSLIHPTTLVANWLGL